MLGSNDRVAIIGAGPSGMAAAEALREKGINNITIFEKKHRVGGMSLSKIYKCKDGREVIYELGSVQPFGSRRLLNMVKKNGLRFGKDFFHGSKPYPIRVYSAKEGRFVADFKEHILGVPVSKWPILFIDNIKMLCALYKFRRLAKPGFAGMDDTKAASMPIVDWIKGMNFRYFDRILNMLFSFSLNAGVNLARSNIPVMLGIKSFISDAMCLPPKYIMGKFYPIREGYQSLWVRVAQKHNVVLDSRISKIIRNRNNIVIEANEKQYNFDKIIIATSPINLKGVMKFTREEKLIFEKIMFSPAWRGAFIANKLPNDAVYVILDEVEDENAPPIILGLIPEGKVDGDKWLYTSMLGSHHPKSIKKLISDTKKVFGGFLDGVDIEWVDSAYWPQFGGHFSCDDVRDRIYDRFEALQGKKNTFYTGELLSGNSHGLVLDYSYSLIDKFARKG